MEQLIVNLDIRKAARGYFHPPERAAD